MEQTTPPNIHAVIISWTGMHDKSLAIAEECREELGSVTIIYSDENPDFNLETDLCDTVKVPNEWFWGKKFEASLKHCEEDILLIIQADASCEDWSQLIGRCGTAFTQINRLGIYAPLIDFTFWDITKVKLGQLGNSGFSLAAQTDGIVFAISPLVRQRMEQLQYDQNVYGWGIDLAAAAFAYAANLLVVIDEQVKVLHPKSSGYSKDEAQAQETEFLKQLNIFESLQCRLLTTYASQQQLAQQPANEDEPTT